MTDDDYPPFAARHRRVALVVAWLPAALLILVLGPWVVRTVRPSVSPMHAYYIGGALGFTAGILFITFADEIHRIANGDPRKADLRELAEKWRDRADNELPNNTVGNIGRTELRRCADELEELTRRNHDD